MPIVDHSTVPEVPWRPNYRKWDIAGPGEGISSNLSYHVAQEGTGPPLHYHEDDELIVIMEGTVEVRIDEEVSLVGADHTVVVPPKVPHSFTVVGPGEAKMMIFFPVPRPWERTTYLEGTPPGKT